MMPDLGQRVAAALDAMQSLSTREQERYVRTLRDSDPELAGRLSALLNLPPSGPGEPTVLDVPPVPSSVVPLAEPGRLEPILTGEPTASVDVRATASFPHGSARDRDSRDAPGVLVLNRYRLLHAVGRGAFGDVWKAFDPVLQKHFAVKVARPDRSMPVAAFLDEARKAASLPKHPAIVHVYDVGANADGWYIISEFIDGESLRNRIEVSRPSFDHAARIVATVATALHAAHLTGLVHRDVKPGNILLDRAGSAYLTDFGLAVREEDQFAERSKVSGTLAYMPPEQISGDTHLLDGRADIYALGAVLYELLTGRQLFRAADLDEYRELILRREPRPPRTIDAAVPVELERICLKCLAKQVKDRYRTAQDLASELEAWLAGSTRSLVTPTPAPAARGRWKVAVIGTVVLALALAGAVALATLGGNSPPTHPERNVDPLLIAAPAPVPVPTPVPPRKVPAVKELLWRGDRINDKWEILGENRLRVHTSSISLLQLGEAKTADWTFTATLKQFGPVGRIGVFLGHRTDPETATANCELLELVLINKQVEIQRTDMKYPLDTKHDWPGPHIVAGALLKKAHEENTFRIVVRNDVLSEVRVNGGPLPGLLNVKVQRSALGGFGVYNRNSEGILTNPLFNENPIPLLVDPSTLTPERP